MYSFLRCSEAAALAFYMVRILARNHQAPITTQKVAETLDASPHHLAKVHGILVKAGLVRALRGPKGGFMLMRDAEEITLLEVFEAVEGRLQPCQCLLGRPECIEEDCILGATSNQVNETILRFLANTTVAELASSRSV